MTRILTWAVIGGTLALSMSITGCAAFIDRSSEFENILKEFPENTAVIAMNDFVPEDTEMFTIVCPYAPVHLVSERLGVLISEVPDYSQVEGLNALVSVADNHVNSVLQFNVLEISLCEQTLSWGQVYPLPSNLAFVKQTNGNWVLDEVHYTPGG